MSLKLKCCGFKDLDGVRKLQGQAVDYVGFILAPSKRQITVEQLAELTPHVPTGMKKVGVWVNPTFEEVVAAVQKAGLDAVQLHGHEPPSFCEQVKQACSVDLIKVFHVGEGRSTALPEAYGAVIDYALLDTYDPQLAGGTGKAFNWEQIGRYREWCDEHGVQLLVAGGITAENVTDLLSHYAIDGVDLASGVETDGKKDVVKIKTLAEKVKRYGNSSKRNR
ncbi:hypothetical protein BEP19_01870 [Ammoniphilus oxalaticus]|uniref:N-(5'-phosphoribosyl)anthranilate isomerase n=1 Tax=Ammoniphilus oxalaticus TaxID=66863 RepID=A0A419SN80_9BACL|nr:phosphoribosylanthranilate isomerase [Ammoniphilus oxalaticus]RKD25713.1 hypothetical protein BEP19_01870 [Ammoniphilus oxalaticus]